MVTSRQITRGVVRTMKAMDRAAKQAERQRIARQNALHKQAVSDSSSRAVAQYEEIIEALIGAHRVDFRRRDWFKTATAPRVAPPERGSDAEDAAQEEFDAYTPNWMSRLFGRQQRDLERLAQRVMEARRRDNEAYIQMVQAAHARNAEIDAAQRLVERQPDAIVEALELHSDLGDLPFSIEGMDTLFIDDRVIALVDGLDLEDMPEESISLLKSGKASLKAIPVGKRIEMHRDAICSAAARVAIECLSVLPVDEVEVLMLTDILDRGTGHIISAPVLHLRVSAQALQVTNMARTEAAAFVERLGGHYEWSKREGFRALNPAAFGIDLNE